MSVGQSLVRAISFAGVSTKDQADKVSLEDQHKENRREAERIGAIVVAELTVPGESRGEGAEIYSFDDACNQTGKGEAYRRLRDIARDGAADLLVCRSIDRVVRTFAGAVSVTDELRRNGIAIYDRSMPPATIDPTEQSEDMMSMMAVAFGSIKGQREVTDIKYRNRNGMAGRVAERGQFPNRPPDGYVKSMDGVVSTGRLEFIKVGFEMYLDGKSTLEIEDYFNSVPFKRPTGKPWPGDGSIWRNYLKRVWVYAGYVEYNKRVRESESELREFIRVKGSHPAILSNQQAVKIEAIMEQSASSPSAKRLFSGIAKCASCERNLHSMKNGGGYISYRCLDKEDRSRSCGRSKSERILKAALLEAFYQLAQNDNMDRMIKSKEGSDDSAERISMLNRRIEEIEQRREKTIDLHLDGVLSKPDLKKRVEDMQADIRALKKSVKAITPRRPTQEIRSQIELIMESADTIVSGQDDQGANMSMRGIVEMWVDFENNQIEVRF